MNLKTWMMLVSMFLWTSVAVAAGSQTKKVRVVGEVKNPGDLTYREKGDGFYYLEATGGPTQFSDLGHVQLVRTDIKTGARQISYQPISQITEVHESDMLIVPPVWTSAGERTLTIANLVVGIVSASLLAFVAVRGAKGSRA